MTRACVLLAPGFEEIEAVTVIDVLRRAEIETVVLGVGAGTVEGAHGIRLTADAALDDPHVARAAWDLVVLPGGMPGSARLRDDPDVQALLRRQHEAGGRLAAICAAPIALSVAGVLEGRRATSYPAFAGELRCRAYAEEPVVVDGPVVTSRGPATALAFALTLVAELVGAERSRALGERMLVPRA
jgi:4-methyl-5(b-hydroxyethyl)-thiazole monophosphate biosynthesis